MSNPKSPPLGTSKTGKVTPKERESLIRKALPDDPIFSRGFVLGGRYPRRTPKDKKEDA